MLAASGTFDKLTDAVVFASWLFYALNAGSVMFLRVREPARDRPFRVPGYPVVPIIFVVLAALLLVNTFIAAPKESTVRRRDDGGRRARVRDLLLKAIGRRAAARSGSAPIRA